MTYKRPESVLVVLYNEHSQVLVMLYPKHRKFYFLNLFSVLAAPTSCTRT